MKTKTPLETARAYPKFIGSKPGKVCGTHGCEDAFPRLSTLNPEEAEPPAYQLLVDFQPGTKAAALADLRDADIVVLERDTPTPIANPCEVDNYPTLMALFLGLLAAGFLGHAIVSRGRNRRRELAVLKARNDPTPP